MAPLTFLSLHSYCYIYLNPTLEPKAALSLCSNSFITRLHYLYKMPWSRNCCLQHRSYPSFALFAPHAKLLKQFPLTLLPSNMMTTLLCAYSWISVNQAWSKRHTNTLINKSLTVAHFHIFPGCKHRLTLMLSKDDLLVMSYKRSKALEREPTKIECQCNTCDAVIWIRVCIASPCASL